MDLDHVIQELRKLNEPVPKPARLPTAQEVDQVEQALGVRFQPDYRKYLLEASDVVYGALEPATIPSEGSHTELLKIAHEAWNRMGVPREQLPICEDNGDYFCITPEGTVAFWSHDSRQTEEHWPNLASWIKQVWIDEG